MKIAIYHNLPSGGAKRTLYESMKRLSQQHTLDVYTLDTADRAFCSLSEFSNAEFVFHFSPSKLFRSPFGRLNQFQRWLDLVRLDRLARQIARIIDGNDYDVVFAQPCMWTKAPLILRYLRTPAVYYCHEPPRHLYEPPFRSIGSILNMRRVLDRVDPFLWLYRATGRRFDQLATRSAKSVLVNSIYIRDRVKQIYGINPIISYHGVDPSVFQPEINKGIGHYVLSVGAIQPHKGYDFLIESFSHIDPKIRPPLYLIGNMENPGEQSYLQALARKKGVDLRIDVGVDQDLLIRQYNNALMVAYAPYNEPFGLVPLEAMACGTPIVGVREGGVMETVVHNYSGLLIERDAVQFGAAIQFLLVNPDIRQNYGINGRKHVLQKWTWEQAVFRLTSYLESCIETAK